MEMYFRGGTVSVIVMSQLSLYVPNARIIKAVAALSDVLPGRGDGLAIM